MHFTKKQKQCSSICKFTHSPNHTFRRQYFLQEDFARFYFPVKVTAKKSILILQVLMRFRFCFCY